MVLLGSAGGSPDCGDLQAGRTFLPMVAQILLGTIKAGQAPQQVLLERCERRAFKFTKLISLEIAIGNVWEFGHKGRYRTKISGIRWAKDRKITLVAHAEFQMALQNGKLTAFEVRLRTAGCTAGGAINGTWGLRK